MMSEQKYYVRLKSSNHHLGIWWCGDRSEWQPYGRDPVCEEELVDFGEREVICRKVSKYIPSFTKTELAEIMDGSLYTQTLFKVCIPPDHVYYGSGEEIVREWINPLIELVPVEDDE